MDVNKRVHEYVKLRNEIKRLKEEFDEKMAPYLQAQETLSKLLLNELNKSKVESMRTLHGTLYKKNHKSASIVDKELFWNFVVENELWDLVDKRANAKACKDYADENKSFPPGLNYTNYVTAGVRQS